MKKLFVCLLLPLCIFSGCLISCPSKKYDMTDWPTINLDLDIESYTEVSLEYNFIPYGDNEEVYYYGASTDKEVIKDMYDMINCFKYSPKTYGNIDTEKYTDKVIIKFMKDSEEYVFQFYAYGIYDGYFIFDNGEIHKYHGAFVAASYEDFKDRLN